jgi:hypothetical protein
MRILFTGSTWLKRITLFVVVTPFMLLWGEIFTEALLPQNLDARMNIMHSDPVVGFTYEPNASTYEKGREYNALYQINSLGLRDREYGVKKDRIFRVLLLGDSFAVSHGMPIEDSLSRQLETALQSVAESEGISVKIEVVNTACGGYSPYNYWKAYRRWAQIFNPDVVLVALSPDDYDCSNEYMHYLIEDGMIVAAFKDGQKPRAVEMNFITRLRKWLLWKSEFYILARNFFYYNDLMEPISLWMHARGEEQNSQIEQYLVPQSESMTKAWGKSFSYLQKLHKETAIDGVPLIVLPIPLKMEVDQEVYQQTLVATGLTPQQIDINQPLKVISTFCKAEHLPLLDPRQAIRERHAKVPCYFVYDGHWIAEGIRAATVSIAMQWHDMGLPPWNHSSK